MVGPLCTVGVVIPGPGSDAKILQTDAQQMQFLIFSSAQSMPLVACQSLWYS